MQGKLIVIEGLDGSGKSTQWEMLKKDLDCTDNAMFITFPDYESESGEIIKRYLSGEFNGAPPKESAYSASSFYAIDRYISCKTSWGDAYYNGAVIVSARYTSSNAIYQMTKLPKNMWQGYLEWLYDYEHDKLGVPKPDLTVFLDLPVEVSQRLLTKRYGGKEVKDIHEGDVSFLMKCRDAAMFVAQREKWVIIDCIDSKTGNLRNPDDINNELAEIVSGTIGRANDRV